MGTLRPEQVVSHYRVIGPLGAGGMGEVYAAEDLTLGRKLALKVLPEELVADENRVRRFALEAKSASSLNHPNIITIYEIGERQGDAPLHFIAMELVNGRTLADAIRQDKTEVRTLLGYLAQAAEGLAKAHDAGIVHRDLKPGNVMVTTDGYAKVLDFGLAKLSDRRSDSEDKATAPTRTIDQTGAGVVVGTVAYMSPEQVAGKGVDHRSDIFSFGCMLYEAATRRRPFAGDTAVETMHRILKEKPQPIEELDPTVPADLRRVIRRCLAKDPEQRYQSMKDIAIELREIAEEYDGLSASASSGSTAAIHLVPARRATRLALVGVLALVVVIAVAVTWFAATRYTREPAAGTNLFANMRMSKIVGDVGGLTLSPDGRYLAYTTGWPRTTLRVRQISTGSEVPIVPPQDNGIGSLSFSANGDYVYFIARDPEHPQYSILFEVSVLGGSPRRRAYDLDSAVSFSQDGHRMAFLRRVPQANETRLVLMELPSGTERVLAAVKTPEQVGPAKPAWSPDGRKLAVLIGEPSKSSIQIAAFDVDTGNRSVLNDWNTGVAMDMVWLPSGTRLVVGMDVTMNNSQVWAFTDDRAAPRRVTNDQNTYTDISSSADGRLVALHSYSESSSAAWNVSVDGDHQMRQVARGEGDPQSRAVADDGTVVQAEVTGERAVLWAFNSDGTGRRPLTPENLLVYSHYLVPHSRRTVFVAYDTKTAIQHVWRVDLDGNNLVQMTGGAGEYPVWPSPVSPDGRFVLFGRVDKANEIWKMALTGGEPVRVAPPSTGETNVIYSGFSTDGSLLAVSGAEFVDGRMTSVVRIFPAAGGDAVATLRMTGNAGLPRWMGPAEMSFLRSTDGTTTLFRWTVKDNVEAPLMRFTHGWMGKYIWSPDRRSIVFLTRVGSVGNLWRWTIGTASPQQITNFPTGTIVDMAWAPDSRSVYFSQGTPTQDAMLVRLDK